MHTKRLHPGVIPCRFEARRGTTARVRQLCVGAIRWSSVQIESAARLQHQRTLWLLREEPRRRRGCVDELSHPPRLAHPATITVIFVSTMLPTSRRELYSPCVASQLAPPDCAFGTLTAPVLVSPRFRANGVTANTHPYLLRLKVYLDPGDAAGRVAVGVGATVTAAAGVASWVLLRSLEKRKLL